MKRFIYFLFALLGFGAVACDNGMHDQVPEYGCPTAHFSLKARVIDEEGNPIANDEDMDDFADMFADSYEEDFGMDMDAEDIYE